MLGLIADQIGCNAQAAYLRYRAPNTENCCNSKEFVGLKRIGKCDPNTSRYGNQRTCTVNNLGNETMAVNQDRLWKQFLTLCEIF